VGIAERRSYRAPSRRRECIKEERPEQKRGGVKEVSDRGGGTHAGVDQMRNRDAIPLWAILGTPNSYEKKIHPPLRGLAGARLLSEEKKNPPEGGPHEQ